MATQQFKKKLCLFIQFIQKNDMKGLKKAMKTKSGKNLKLVQRGILIAFQNGNCEALKILISSPLPDLFDYEVNLLHCVVMTSKVEFLKILISDKRVDVNRVVGDEDGRTPLMVACTTKNLEMVKELLRHPKIDVNAQDEINEWFAISYALHMGTLDILQSLLSHKDISHSSIQESLLMAFSAISFEHFPIDLELLNMLLKNSFENEFNLKKITNRRFKVHDHLQSCIAEEVEMKIREEYYNGVEEVSEESLCNKAFNVSFDVLQASILKCECLQCFNVKNIKRKVDGYRKIDSMATVFWHGSFEPSPETKLKNLSTKLPRKILEYKCLLRTKVFDKTKSDEVKSEFITSHLPDIFKHILFHGGYEKAIDEIINGTKSVENLCEEAEKDENIYHNAKNNDETKADTEMDFNTLCWSCSVTEVKLYKCGGCRKARYCGKQCIEDDWEEHMQYCLKMQEKRNKKRSLRKNQHLNSCSG